MFLRRSSLPFYQVKCFIAAFLAASVLSLPTASAALRAGTAVANLIKDKPTARIHDPLLAKVLVIDDGGSRAVMICMDIMEATDAITAGIRGGIQRELGIAPDRVLVSAAQNHRTGDQEAEDLIERIVAAAKKAVENLAPARVGAGAGREDRITMNRRLRMKDGTHWTIRHSTPSPADADVAGVGPFDPEIVLLRVDREDGRPLALVYNFAGHPYAGVPEGGVTADYPAFASAVIEDAWPGAVALFMQGFCGDITPVEYKNFDMPPPTKELGRKLGQSALAAAQKIEMKPDAVVRAAREVIDLPRRTDTLKRIEVLKAEKEKIIQFLAKRTPGRALNCQSFLTLSNKHAMNPDNPSTNISAYEQEKAVGVDDRRRLDAANQSRIENYRRYVESMDRLMTILTNIELLEEHAGKIGDGPIKADIQALRIGDCVAVTFPGEPFAEVQLRIKKQSPFRHTMVAGNANGEIAGHYAPTADDYDKQAYGDSCTELAPEWQAVYEQKALDLIRRLQ